MARSDTRCARVDVASHVLTTREIPKETRQRDAHCTAALHAVVVHTHTIYLSSGESRRGVNDPPPHAYVASWNQMDSFRGEWVAARAFPCWACSSVNLSRFRTHGSTPPARYRTQRFGICESESELGEGVEREREGRCVRGGLGVREKGVRVCGGVPIVVVAVCLYVRASAGVQVWNCVGVSGAAAQPPPQGSARAPGW